MTYRPYWKSEFQNCLTSVINKGNLLRWEEISDFLSKENKIWEYVYKFHLKNPAVSIIIYSSVCKKTDRSRDINSDAVRIVLKWHTTDGDKYCRVSKKYRVHSLFKNLSAELVSTSENCFELNKYLWVNSLIETDT